ncbi:MAG: amino acid ABC transporter substrate-binding protein [Desulfobacterales bacterium]|nr:amino acid ABC transporter substrate-binding protein [Desulfobacterales bacterium]
MKYRFFSQPVFLFILVTIFMFDSMVIAENRTLLIGINEQDNFPSMGAPGTEKNLYPGILIEEMRFIAKEAKIKVKYVRVPWKRCLVMLARGEMDGLICGSYKKERKKYGVFPRKRDGKIDPSKRFSDSSYYLYVKKDSKLKWDGKKFNNYNVSIGAELGFSIVPALKDIGIEAEVVYSVRINFKKLMLDRIDGVAAHESSGDAIMLGYPDVKKIDIPLKTKAYYLIMSHQIYKSDPGLVNKIWKACAKIQGKIVKKIKAKYIGKKSWEEMR